MRMLILKHNGHEAHVPYELPDSLRFDCYVPGYGVYAATVDVRAEQIEVIDLRTQDGTGWIHPVELERDELSAVLEQAGDVCAVFLKALPIEPSECERATRESTADFERRVEHAWGRWNRQASRENNLVLSTIAELALLESDKATLFSRLPQEVSEPLVVPAYEAKDWTATAALDSFIKNVLVPRAQDLATAAAKRRETEWQADEMIRHLESDIARRDDLAIKAAKERA